MLTVVDVKRVSEWVSENQCVHVTDWLITMLTRHGRQVQLLIAILNGVEVMCECCLRCHVLKENPRSGIYKILFSLFSSYFFVWFTPYRNRLQCGLLLPAGRSLSIHQLDLRHRCEGVHAVQRLLQCWRAHCQLVHRPSVCDPKLTVISRTSQFLNGFCLDIFCCFISFFIFSVVF